MGWRLVVAGLLACAVVTARPVAAGDEGSTSDDVSAFDEPMASSDTWSAVGWGALTGLTNLIYIPAKLAYAGIGGLTGGLALGLTGGDMQTASAIWEPSLHGDYFLTPGMVQGEESIAFAGASAELAAPLPDDEPPAAAPDDRPFGY